MKINVGVTGASGFIGEHLIQQLLTNGYQVTALVRSKKEYPSSVNVILGSLNKTASVKQFLKNVDVVVHLAGRQLPPNKLFFQDNVVATNTLVNCMFDFPIQHAIFLSTVAVYGDQKSIVHKESEECTPTTYYGFTKYLTEKIFQYWETTSESKLTILRPFNVYGKGSTKGVVYNLLKNIQEDKQITVYGDGSQSRDFLYVDDIVNAIIVVIKRKEAGIFNLGTGKKNTIIELVEKLKKISSQPVKLKFEKNEVGKTKDILYSVDKASNVLGWKASIFLEEGLKKLQ